MLARTLLLAALLSSPSRASPSRAESPLNIDIYTMGPGDDLFSAFGHAAICVNTRCYNYGTADFSTPGPLTWDFIRGRARFWVGVTDLHPMLAFYRREDRTVYRQRLDLAPERARAIAAALEASTDERVRYYRYHHFDDNCTTRIRDLLDRELSGALSRDSGGPGPTFRQRARAGFAGQWPLLAALDLLLGRRADRPTDRWSAMFLPDELRAELEARLGVRPEVLYQRTRPLPGGSTALGSVAWLLAALALALLVALGARLGRIPRRATLLVAGLALGLVATALWSLAALSTFPELTRNEALLAFWPTDLALGFLSANFLRRYALVRLATVALLALAHLVVLTQPLAPLAFVALPLTAILAGRLKARRTPHDH
jgi:Domain of unknown function (DUF4105)